MIKAIKDYWTFGAGSGPTGWGERYWFFHQAMTAAFFTSIYLGVILLAIATMQWLG